MQYSKPSTEFLWGNKNVSISPNKSWFVKLSAGSDFESYKYHNKAKRWKVFSLIWMQCKTYALPLLFSLIWSAWLFLLRSKPLCRCRYFKQIHVIQSNYIYGKFRNREVVASDQSFPQYFQWRKIHWHHSAHPLAESSVWPIPIEITIYFTQKIF